jgi:hypothetical protein
MPSTVAIGKIAHTVKRPDIIAIKTVRNAKVSAIFSCVREKSRLSFDGNRSCQYPGSKITALEASDTGCGGDSGAALGFLMSVVANALLYYWAYWSLLSIADFSREVWSSDLSFITGEVATST